jgi:hypothetical protein
VSYVLSVLDEIELSPETKARLVPAIKHPITGKLYTGRRGEIHPDILKRTDLPETWAGLDRVGYKRDIHSGYYDHTNKKFYSRDDIAGGLDATELMSKWQRIKRFGYEALGRASD